MLLQGIFSIIWGIAWMVIGVIAGISWVTFCFGSVIGVILILIFAPPLLTWPFGLCVYGFVIFMQGIELIKGNNDTNV
jgi:hypothetical protein